MKLCKLEGTRKSKSPCWSRPAEVVDVDTRKLTERAKGTFSAIFLAVNHAIRTHNRKYTNCLGTSSEISA